MNLFGAFSFGKLIKTFLPGFILSLAILIYLEILFEVNNLNFNIYRIVSESSTLFTVLIIPISITLGVFSNSIFFTFLNRKIITNKFYTNNESFCKFEKSVYMKMKNRFIKALDIDEKEANDFKKHIDVNMFLFNKTDLNKINSIKDSYWNYLEFQLNILLAINFITPALIYSFIKFFLYQNQNIIPLVLVIIFFILSIIFLNFTLIKSAKINYSINRKKFLSLNYGSYYFNEIKRTE